MGNVKGDTKHVDYGSRGAVDVLLARERSFARFGVLMSDIPLACKAMKEVTYFC